MNKAILPAILLLIQGCTLSSGVSGSASECPETPKDSLSQDAIETVYLSQGAVEKSGQVSTGRPRGYSFEGKTGQNIDHTTLDNVCIWVYAPDNTLVNDNAITVNGVHIVQVSALQGSTSYTLDLRLKDPRVAPRNQETPQSSDDVNSEDDLPKGGEKTTPSSDEKEENQKKPAQQAQAECGSGKPTKSERRYRVLARGASLSDIQSEHCKDAYTRQDGWIQVASFNSERGAKSFIEEKRSQLGGTWKTESFWFDK